MAQPSDLTKIRGLVARARTRIRTQSALEVGTTALILALAGGAASIYLVRTERVATTTGIALLVACAGIVIAGALIGYFRPVDDERVARRIDRASDLADRLSTAVAFDRILATDQTLDLDGREFMEAAIRDAARAAARANVAGATPYAAPRDLRVAIGFAIVAVLVALLRIQLPDNSAHLYGAKPELGPPGVTVVLVGEHLMTGVARRPAAARLPDRSDAVLGAAGAAMPLDTWVPANASVYLGIELRGKDVVAAGIPVDITRWSADRVWIKIPHDAPFGMTSLTVFIGDKPTESVKFRVVNPKDSAFHREDAAHLEDDELAYARSLLDDLRNVAKTDKVDELEDFAAKIEQLLDQAERGEITKEQLLEKLAEADQAMDKGAEPSQDEIDKDLQDTGKELQKSELTKELGKALEKGDLEQAKDELEQLAEQLADGKLDDKQKQEIAKAMDKAAQQFDKKEQERDDKTQAAKDKLEQEIRKLEKQKDEAKTEQERQDAERRLEKKQRELKKLEKDQKDKQDSAQRRALKRLHKDMDKTAEDLQKKKDPNKDEQEQEQEEQEQEQQASQKLKDAAEETGKVDQDKRKQAAQKKVASQMEDLREAMRRAKRRGQKGGQDPFGRQGKNKDFMARARGQKGSGQAWKPGQGKRPGQGQGQQPGGQQPGGQGQNPGGQQWGVGHDPNLTGDPTGKSGDIAEQDLQGKQGKEGSSKREIILAAAQKGFAGERYREVFTDYKKQVEDVMRAEKVPSSYKYYLKRYFNKIKPHSMD